MPINCYAEESRRVVCFFGSGSGILWPTALRDAILFKAVYSWRCADEDRHRCGHRTHSSGIVSLISVRSRCTPAVGPCPLIAGRYVRSPYLAKCRSMPRRVGDLR